MRHRLKTYDLEKSVAFDECWCQTIDLIEFSKHAKFYAKILNIGADKVSQMDGVIPKDGIRFGKLI